MAVDQIAIARSMLDYINAWPSKPASFSLEGILKDAPGAMLLQLASSGVLKRYIDGSYIGVWSFAVYIRLNKADTSEKLEALDLYEDLLKYFRRGLPELCSGAEAIKIELLSTPALAAAYDNGTEDYQATYRLRYKAQSIG